MNRKFVVIATGRSTSSEELRQQYPSDIVWNPRLNVWLAREGSPGHRASKPKALALSR